MMRVKEKKPRKEKKTNNNNNTACDNLVQIAFIYFSP